MTASDKKFSLRQRLRSFSFAWNGLRRFFATEHNAWIHLSAALLALLVGFLLNLGALEWIGLLFAIGFVLCAEAFNTCVEKMMDQLAPGYDERTRYIKDLAAGAVLIAAITAALVGLIIFIPKIMVLCR